MSLIRLENQTGQAMKQGDLTITPLAQTVQMRLPESLGGYLGGALTWIRPVAVEVVHVDGEVTIVPIRDITRLGLLAILGSSLLCGLMLWLLGKKDRSNEKFGGNDD